MLICLISSAEKSMSSFGDASSMNNGFLIDFGGAINVCLLTEILTPIHINIKKLSEISLCD